MRKLYGILTVICLSLVILAGCSGDEPEGGNDDVVIGPLLEEAAVDASAEYERHICVMEFTGQWCANCPRGYDIINLAVNYDDRYKDITHIIALHDNSGGEDEFAAPLQSVQKEIHTTFELGAYPSVVVDLMTGVVLPDGNLGAALQKSLEDPALCGVAVSSDYDGNTGKAEVKIRLASAGTDSYRAAVFVVEDGIVAKQYMEGYINEAYPHRHVARRMLSGSYIGETMGRLEPGMQVSRTYSLTVDPEWNVEKTYIYALAINGGGQINNVAVCGLDGGNMDYNYKR